MLCKPLNGQQYFQHPKERCIIVGAEITIRANKDGLIEVQ
jgi:hypothetical protein